MQKCRKSKNYDSVREVIMLLLIHSFPLFWSVIGFNQSNLEIKSLWIYFFHCSSCDPRYRTPLAYTSYPRLIQSSKVVSSGETNKVAAFVAPF